MKQRDKVSQGEPQKTERGFVPLNIVRPYRRAQFMQSTSLRIMTIIPPLALHDLCTRIRVWHFASRVLSDAPPRSQAFCVYSLPSDKKQSEMACKGLRTTYNTSGTSKRRKRKHQARKAQEMYIPNLDRMSTTQQRGDLVKCNHTRLLPPKPGFWGMRSEGSFRRVQVGLTLKRSNQLFVFVI